MELCTARTFSNLPHHTTLFSANQNRLPITKPSSISRFNPGLLYYPRSSLKSKTSEDTSTEASQYVVKEPTAYNAYGEMQKEKEPTEYNGEVQKEVGKDDSPMDGQMQTFDFLKLDLKLDSEDSYSYIVLGGGAFVALWLATAVVGAIDSIPVFPKLLEVVGLGYSLWFSTRYLIFKENRKELTAKIEEIKQQVLGSNGD